jgi:membrane associated rhomboid family serine protease
LQVERTNSSAKIGDDPFQPKVTITMGWRPPILELLEFPVSLSLAVLNVIVYFRLVSNQVDVTTVAVSSEAVLGRKQYWRVVSATFSHFDILHIVANTASAWSCRVLEFELGIPRFLIDVTILVTLSSFVDALIRKHFLPQTADVWCIGYSAVVCGLQAIMSAHHSYFEILGFRIPWSITPFLNIILIQFIIPRASFIGHLSGVIIGFLISWRLFDWITVRLYWNLLPWLVFFFFCSYVRDHADSFAWFSVSNEAPAPRTTIIDGRLTRVDP